MTNIDEIFKARNPAKIKRNNDEQKRKKIKLKELVSKIEKNKLIAITGKNGVGKTHTINVLYNNFYGTSVRHNALFDTRNMGSDKDGYVGEQLTSKVTNYNFVTEKVKRLMLWSHGQSLGRDIVSFLLSSRDKPVVFIDEPETALDLEAKHSILNVLHMDKDLRPIVIATNCPFFVLKADLVFELTKERLRLWTDEERKNFKDSVLKIIN